MALLKLSILELFLLLTIMVSSVFADGPVCSPLTKLIRRCNNKKGNVVVEAFHRSMVLSEYPVPIKYLLYFLVLLFYHLFLDKHDPKCLLVGIILFYFNFYVL
ncbi:hypothetical protein CARUB_v10027504mg [Capsella rubella]|uniref:Hydrophobic seed protein domain-containing protein n=1 Tax=Capsella rubella TaxID=81985 RepID=R0GSZ6_9BRAS|nr:hypothetical protein CARUB_v10027504mg [Capsella rubella]